jgi:hypothetical protein
MTQAKSPANSSVNSSVKSPAASPAKSGTKKAAPARRGRKNEAGIELAAKLKSWGEANQISDDAYLEGLEAALEEDRDLAVWASTDVIELLPIPHVSYREGRLYALLTLVRNVLVFVPVGLTWLAVSKSTTAFAAYSKASGGNVVNFLQFWEDGYGILAKEWTIGHVALLDFAIIVAIIALTLLTPIMARKAEGAAEEAEKRVHKERLVLAVEVTGYLFDKRHITPMTMTSSLARSVQNLATAARNLDASSKRIEKLAKSLPNNAAIIKEIHTLGKSEK